MKQYITKTGDTWDSIAKEVYGNEYFAGFLMENNREKLDTFVFSAGEKLNIPKPPAEQNGMVPPWRLDAYE